jgi:serine/threonine protein kinase
MYNKRENSPWINSCVDLAKNMLDKSIERRFTVGKALDHSFFAILAENNQDLNQKYTNIEDITIQKKCLELYRQRKKK